MSWRVTARPPKGRDGWSWQLVTRSPSGKVSQRTARTADPDKARDLAAQEQARLNLEHSQAVGGDLESVLRARLAHLQASGEAAENTLTNLRTALVRLRGLVGVPTRGSVLAARDALLREGLSPATVRSYLHQAASAWRWAYYRELVSEPWPDLPKQRVKHTKKRPLSEAEARAVLAELEARRPEFYPVAVLLYATGARLSETLALREADLDRAAGVVRFRSQNTKTGEQREVWAGHDVLALIPPAEPGELVFKTKKGKRIDRRRFGYAWRVALRRAGFPPGEIDVHSLRRTWITDALRSGVGLPDTMRQTGHASPTIHLRYARRVPTPDEAGVRAVVEKRAAAVLRAGGDVVRFPGVAS